MPKVFYETGTWKLPFKCQNLAFKMLEFGFYEIEPWKQFFLLNAIHIGKLKKTLNNIDLTYLDIK